MRLKNPLQEVNGKIRNDHNLRRIAISNLLDEEKSLVSWWHNKYRIPPKQVTEYTTEELYIEYLEDFYRKNPREKDLFLASIAKIEEEDFEVKLDPEVEDHAIKVLKKARKKLGKEVDIKKYQSDDVVSDEEFKKILDSIGKKTPNPTPKPNQVVAPVLGEDEFEDSF